MPLNGREVRKDFERRSKAEQIVAIGQLVDCDDLNNRRRKLIPSLLYETGLFVCIGNGTLKIFHGAAWQRMETAKVDAENRCVIAGNYLAGTEQYVQSSA